MKRWLFSPAIDTATFGGTALIALLLLFVAPRGGDAPEWTWITGVLLVDVAHVWSTTFVVYLDPVELRRRPALYAGTPILCFAAALALYACGDAIFWRCIAYLAVFHFIRQQYGWVMLYRARNGERTGRLLDAATIYLATLYPLLWWHAHLPRRFAWMKDGDFVAGVPRWLATAAGIAYAGVLVAYVARALVQRPVSWGKHLIVATTAACWYVGIVVTNSDYAFTVTNVFVHGIPYMVLVYLYARAAARETPHGLGARMVGGRLARGVLVFLGSLWLVAYAEELLWDRAFWHDRPWLFGHGWQAGGAALILAPLLATPQLTHYVLDGFLWRRSQNPRLGRLL